MAPNFSDFFIMQCMKDLRDKGPQMMKVKSDLKRKSLKNLSIKKNKKGPPIYSKYP